MKKLFILLLLFCPLMGMAQIQAKKGDIVVFNMPMQIEKIEVQLFQCVLPLCTHLKPLTMPSPELNPGAYYVFRLSDKDKTRLAGSEIGIKVNRVSDNRSSNQLTVITKYQADENPFYQIICWTRKDVAPYFACSNSNSVSLTIRENFLGFLSIRRLNVLFG